MAQVTKYKWVILAVAISLVIIIALIVSKKVSIQPYSKLPQTAPENNIATGSAQPFKIQNGPTDFVADCKVIKEGNALVVAVTTIPNENTIVGALLGNINQITGSDTDYKIDLLSPTASQRYIFDIKDESGLVRDSNTNKEIKLSDLKRGQTLLVSYNCTPNPIKDQFKITDIARTSM